MISPTFEISGKSIETPVPFGNPDSPAFQSHHVFVVPMGSSIFLTPPSKKNKQTNKTNRATIGRSALSLGSSRAAHYLKIRQYAAPAGEYFQTKFLTERSVGALNLDRRPGQRRNKNKKGLEPTRSSGPHENQRDGSLSANERPLLSLVASRQNIGHGPFVYL